MNSDKKHSPAACLILGRIQRSAQTILYDGCSRQGKRQRVKDAFRNYALKNLQMRMHKLREKNIGI